MKNSSIITGKLIPFFNRILISIIAFAGFAILIVGCQQGNEPDHELNVELKTESGESLEQAFVKTLGEIDRQLEKIKERDGVILLGPESNVELDITVQERISRNIKMIEHLLSQNEDKIEELKTALNTVEEENNQLLQASNEYNFNLDERQQLLADLKYKLAHKESKIAALNNKLGKLKMENTIQEQKIGALEGKLNAAYYVMGKYKNLKKNGIAQKEGGWLWFGKHKDISENLNTRHFRAIDIQKSTIIPVNRESIRLLSDHPVDSYTIEEKEDGTISHLKIHNPIKFWQVSNFLVIEDKS